MPKELPKVPWTFGSVIRELQRLKKLLLDADPHGVAINAARKDLRETLRVFHSAIELTGNERKARDLIREACKGKARALLHKVLKANYRKPEARSLAQNACELLREALESVGAGLKALDSDC